jgi:hypothetical protein
LNSAVIGVCIGAATQVGVLIGSNLGNTQVCITSLRLRNRRCRVRIEIRLCRRDRIEATTATRSTPTNPPNGKPTAARSPMQRNCFVPIHRTGRLESTGRRSTVADCLIRPNDSQKHPCEWGMPAKSRLPIAARRPGRGGNSAFHRVCSTGSGNAQIAPASWVTWLVNASVPNNNALALGRTTMSTGGSAFGRSRNTSRIRRRMRLRDTALPSDLGMAYPTRAALPVYRTDACKDSTRTRRPSSSNDWKAERPVRRSGPTFVVGRLGRESGATLGPTCLQHRATASGGHAVTETMLLSPTPLIWLECALHRRPPTAQRVPEGSLRDVYPAFDVSRT